MVRSQKNFSAHWFDSNLQIACMGFCDGLNCTYLWIATRNICHLYVTFLSVQSLTYKSSVAHVSLFSAGTITYASSAYLTTWLAPCTSLRSAAVTRYVRNTWRDGWWVSTGLHKLMPINQVRSQPAERACSNAKLRLQSLQEPTVADGVECGCKVRTEKHGSSPVVSSCVDTSLDVEQGGLGRLTRLYADYKRAKFVDARSCGLS